VRHRLKRKDKTECKAFHPSDHLCLIRPPSLFPSLPPSLFPSLPPSLPSYLAVVHIIVGIQIRLL